MDSRLDKAVKVYTTVTTAYETAKRVRNYFSDRMIYVLTIDSDDAVYDDVQHWLLTVIDSSKQRKLNAHTRHRRNSYDEDNSGQISKITLRHDDGRQHTINVKGFKVKVHVDREEDGLNINAGKIKIRPDKIVFTTYSKEAIDAVVEQMNDLLANQAKTEREAKLFIKAGWGGWVESSTPLRDLDSVILKAGQRERLVADLGAFLNAETEYVRRGIPWHRGYLFHGQPGTGKTSIAKALAKHFGLNLWYLTLGDIEKDSKLISMINEIGPRSILLLEDIDVFRAVREREAEATEELTMSGLLNALDGVSTPHGLITIMTTNHVEVLDDAIFRPGRIDINEKIDLPDDEQANRIFEYFYRQKPTAPIKANGRSVAEMMEVYKRHMFDGAAAERELNGRN